MERYIEVIGEGQFLESAAKYVAEITLEVRASKNETAFAEAGELCDDALSTLRRSEILDDEIVEGGSDVGRPWYWKKQVGQNAIRRIILKVADFGRLNRALEALEPLQSRSKERRTISVDMRQPEFDSTSETRAAALTQAFDDARTKAVRLASAMNCRLGDPLLAEEGGWVKRNSGFSGDEDWSGDSARFGYGAGLPVLMAAPGAAEPEQELLRPSRTIFVKCRFRFALHSQ